MSGINKVILVGNLGKDPEVRHLDNGRAVANFPMATSEVYKNREGERVTNTEWHNVVLWTPLAEVAEKYLKKGNQVYIEGKITTRSYEDKEGQKKYITEVVGREMTLLGSPQGGNTGGGNSGSSDDRVSLNQDTSSGAETDIDDLPF